jgi:hypothetical protein
VHAVMGLEQVCRALGPQTGDACGHAL